MKIIRWSLVRIVPFLLIVALPTTGASLGGSGSDTDVEQKYGITEDSTGWALSDAVIDSSLSDTLGTKPSFPSPSYILEGIQNAYLTPALRMTGAIQAFTASDPSPSDFWELAEKSQKSLQNYVHRLLEAAEKYFKSARFADITSAMNQIVNTTSTFRDNIKGTLDAHHVTFDMLTEELETIFMAIASDLEKIPPPDEAPGHAERVEMVDNILDDTERELLKLATRYGIEDDVVAAYLDTLKQHVRVLTVAVGDINEQHPQLLPALTFCVATLLIPESWILRPFLSLFGFGPGGPVKGSAAAWLQRRLWGAAVRSGSWFSWLQAAGMGVLPRWAGLVTKMPLMIGGLLAMLLPCLHRG